MKTFSWARMFLVVSPVESPGLTCHVWGFLVPLSFVWQKIFLACGVSLLPGFLVPGAFFSAREDKTFTETAHPQIRHGVSGRL